MSTFVVGIDFDGVITNPHRLKAEELRRRGHDVEARQTQRAFVVDVLGVPLEDYEAAAFAANCERLSEVPLADGALRTLETLSSGGVRVVVITSRRDHELPHLRDYVEAYDLPVDGVRAAPRGEKAGVLSEIEAHLHADDTPAELLPLVRDRTGAKPFFFEHEANGWVGSGQLPSDVARGGWTELEETVRQLRSLRLR